MSTDDNDLPLNVAGNPYDPIFAGRIEALGGRSGPPSVPRPPRKSGGSGAWGGWLVAVILGVNVLRSCSNMSSPKYDSTIDHNSFRGNNLPAEPFQDEDQNRQFLDRLEELRKAQQELDDPGQGNRPGQAKQAGDGRGPEQADDRP